MRDPLSPPHPTGRRVRRRIGASWADARPEVETYHVTGPDLDRRRYLTVARSRLGWAVGAFAILFLAVAVKTTIATVINPRPPSSNATPLAQIIEQATPRENLEVAVQGQRASITDRNGKALAVSLPTVSLFADPRHIIDPLDAVRKLKSVLPRLDEERAITRLSSEKKFVYLERQITRREQVEINNLGLPGIEFKPAGQRQYPLGRTAAHVLGGVDVDEKGVAGVEKAFNQRLTEQTAPLRLSLDIAVQTAVREELLTAIGKYDAIGGAGIVMDVNTGEILALVSLPDYDANQFRSAGDVERFNRTITGRYEPGSTFKLQTAAMALDYGTARPWDSFDASRPISIGRFTISDFEGKKRALTFPEVLAYSSNIAAAKMAQQVGAERQRKWLKDMGMFERVGIELPESDRPMYQSAAQWKEIATLTVGFGHGISVTPMHIVKGLAAIANGGIVRPPTILAVNPGEAAPGTRVMKRETSDLMRRMMRLIVTDGFGKTAEAPGFYPGGKTGTAEKVGGGAYKRKANVTAFAGVFPMHAPRYAVYMMLDEGKGNKSTYGYSTAGWLVAPAAGEVIKRVGPILGLMPDTTNVAAISQQLAHPLHPTRPSNAPRNTAVGGDRPSPNAPKPALTVPPTHLPPATVPTNPPPKRHQTGPDAPKIPAAPDVGPGVPRPAPAPPAPGSLAQAPAAPSALVLAVPAHAGR